MLMIVLRFTHIFFGALWVGMMAFQVFFLTPALGQAGPDAGKVMAALMRMRIPVIVPIFALLTLISGFWLFQRLSGGAPDALMATPLGKAFGFGGLSALLAFFIGIFVMRPAMMKSVMLAQSGDPAHGPEIQRLRARGAVVGRVVTVMLLFALAAMAVARYL
jgi:uncharacterized membrane protein